MVDLGAERLPAEHRGMGTSLILGAGDLGMLISYIALGQVIDTFGFDKGLSLLSGIVALTAVVFCVARREVVFGRRRNGGGVQVGGEKLL